MKQILLFIAAAMVAAGFFESCQKGPDGGKNPAETVAVTGIALDQPTLNLNAGDDPVTLLATITPADATDKTITWTSDDTDVATVSQQGVVTAVGNGTATITASANGGTGITDQCVVTVGPAGPVAVTGVTLNVTSHKMCVNESFQLVATVQPANATNKNIAWANLAPEILNVSETGLVMALGTLKYGFARVTVVTEDGDFPATCEFTLEGANVAGIRWAEYNVDVTGQFVEKTTDRGAFYQWGNDVSWNSATGEAMTWTASDGSAWANPGSSEITWPTAKSPCPTGYRLPTKAELETLNDETKVYKDFLEQGVHFTDKATAFMVESEGLTTISARGIVLPPAGNLAMGMLVNFGGAEGYYWASDTESAGKAWRMKFNKKAGTNFGVDVNIGSVDTNNGYQVRCVMVNQPAAQ